MFKSRGNEFKDESVNRILLDFRFLYEDRWNEIPKGAAIWITQDDLGYYPDDGWIGSVSQDEIEHARKVLTRLAALG
jgi:hypothetical protein